MTTGSRQKAAARSNIRKAVAPVARQKRTIAHLPAATREAASKRGARLARGKRHTDGE